MGAWLQDVQRRMERRIKINDVRRKLKSIYPKIILGWTTGLIRDASDSGRDQDYGLLAPHAQTDPSAVRLLPGLDCANEFA